MYRPYHPFHYAGYRCNPFRALTPEEAAEIAVFPEPVQQALESGFTLLQLLGDPGRGKTTILRGLRARLSAPDVRAAHEYIPEGQCRFHTDLRPLALFFLDEAQRLSRRERRRLITSLQNRSLRLLFTSHEDLTPLFAFHNLPLTSIDLNAHSERHFCAALQRRLDYFALPDAPRALLTPGALRFLRETFGTDLRGAEQFLYEVFQERQDPEAVREEILMERFERIRQPLPMRPPILPSRPRLPLPP